MVRSCGTSCASVQRMTACQRWLIVVGGFICYCLADGFSLSVGVLYSYFLGAFNLSSSSTAVLPGLVYAIPQFTAIFLCPLLETYGYSSGASWGAILLSISCIASAFAPNMQILYFTFGLLSSFGLQLTYSSAIMAVTETFKDDRFFGLAVGLTMCGSGIGSFTFNPFVAWLLETWTWREVLFIEGSILLNSMVSASCFHHLDAVRFLVIKRELSPNILEVETDAKPLAIEGSQLIATPMQVDATEGFSRSTHEVDDQDTSFSASVQCLWSCMRYILCIPSRCRFLPLGCSRPLIADTDSVESIRKDSINQPPGCVEFQSAFKTSLKQLLSPGLWRNPTYLVYILANGLTGAGIVIPWTFIYDHGILSLSDKQGNLDDTNMSSVSWLPSCIGMGSLFGQIAFGFLTSQFGQLGTCCSSGCLSQTHDSNEEPPCNQRNPISRFFCHLWSDKTLRHLVLFMVVLLWNGLSTLLITLLPLSSMTDQVSVRVSFLSLPAGQAMAAACFLVGISFGGIYVLYPQILMDTLGETLWPAGLGVFLFVNGSMNLIGTTVGGRLFDIFQSYKPAFLLATVIPFVSLALVIIQLVVYSPQRHRPAAYS